MKYLSVSILFICLVAATFSNWWLIVAYNVNQKYISQQLCENRNMPAMHCNGRCYLSRQLEKEEKPSSPFSTKGTEKFEIQFFLTQLSSLNTNTLKVVKVYCNQQQHFTLQQFISSSFHPPQA